MSVIITAAQAPIKQSVVIIKATIYSSLPSFFVNLRKSVKQVTTQTKRRIAINYDNFSNRKIIIIDKSVA